MTSTRLATLPRLGDDETIYADRCGPPLWVEPTAEGHISAYACEGVVVRVLFRGGATAALRLPYPPSPRRALLAALATSYAPIDGSPARLLLGDGGWLLALPSCPPAALQALAAA
jgi:hypothetical protein